MEEELRRYLDERFGRVDAQMAALKTDVATLKADVGGLKVDVAALKADVGRIGPLAEAVQDQVRLVAEGHMVLYGAIDRHYEEVRAELRDVRSLLKVWNELVSKRLGGLEHQMRELVKR